MTDWPYYWSRPLIIRMPRGRGLVLGWWRRHRQLDVTAHLAQALCLDEIDADDLPAETGIEGAPGQWMDYMGTWSLDEIPEDIRA